MDLLLSCFNCASIKMYGFSDISLLYSLDPTAEVLKQLYCCVTTVSCTVCWIISKFKVIITFFWTVFLFMSAKILFYPYFIDWSLYYSINFVFCLSKISLYSPFYKFLKALAYWAAWPCMRNILLCSVYLSYLANLYFYLFFYNSFCYYFFLY